MKYPKVLIAAPTSVRHDYIIDEYLASLNNLSYPNYDVYLVDTTEESKGNDFYDYLKNKKGITVGKRPLKRGEEHPLQMLARVREDIRKKFLNVFPNYIKLQVYPATFL